jgi:hypothetical protein
LEMFFCLRAIGFFIKEQRVALVIEGWGYKFHGL